MGGVMLFHVNQASPATCQFVLASIFHGLAKRLSVRAFRALFATVLALVFAGPMLANAQSGSNTYGLITNGSYCWKLESQNKADGKWHSSGSKILRTRDIAGPDSRWESGEVTDEGRTITNDGLRLVRVLCPEHSTGLGISVSAFSVQFGNGTTVTISSEDNFTGLNVGGGFSVVDTGAGISEYPKTGAPSTFQAHPDSVNLFGMAQANFLVPVPGSPTLLVG